MSTVDRGKYHDPYRELEAFLQEAQEDIKRVFESVSKNSASSTSASVLLNGSSDDSVRDLEPSTKVRDATCVSDKFSCLPVNTRRNHQISRSATAVPAYRDCVFSPVPNTAGDRNSSPVLRPSGSESQSRNTSNASCSSYRPSNENPMVKRTESTTIQRSLSDVSAYKSSPVALRSKMNGNMCGSASRSVFTRPPSMVEQDIDILKSWAEHFVKQVHDAFSSVESLDSEDFISEFDAAPSHGGCVGAKHHLKSNGNNCNGGVAKGRNSASKCDFSNQTDELSPNLSTRLKRSPNDNRQSNGTDIHSMSPGANYRNTNGNGVCSNNESSPGVERQRGKNSSRNRKSSSSSSSSQVKPEDVVIFLKRVEASIRSSNECDSQLEAVNNDSVFVDEEPEANKAHDAMTQTSPGVSRSSSAASAPIAGKLSCEVTTSKNTPATSSLSSMDHADEDSSSLSCLSDEGEDDLKTKPRSSSFPNGAEDGSSLSLSACSSSSVLSDDFNANSFQSDKPADADPIFSSHCSPNQEMLLNSPATIPRDWNEVKSAGVGANLFESKTLPNICKCKNVEICYDRSGQPENLQFRAVQVAVHPAVQNLREDRGLFQPVKAYSVPTLQSKLSSSGSSLPSTSGHIPNCVPDFQTKTFPIKNQTRKHIAELEAAEACKWLRAAGFPQYAQMYEEHQFPVDISAVQKDHYFLDQDSIQSLFRRLDALNKCAKMKINNLPRQVAGAESDEEDICALSENWMFTNSDRRWSRVNQEENEVLAILKERKSASTSPKSLNVPSSMEAHSSFDSVLTVEDYIGGSGHNPTPNISGHEIVIDHASSPVNESLSSPADSPAVGRSSRSASAERSPSDEPSGNFRRTGSERLKDGAKAFLKRVESFKSRRRKRTSANSCYNRDAVLFDDSVEFESGKTNNSYCVRHRLKPPTLVLGGGDLEDELTNCNLNSNLKHKSHSKKSSGRRSFGTSVKKIDAEALSDSECSSATSPSVFPSYLVTDANSNNTSLLEQYWKSSRLIPGSPKSVSPTKDNGENDRKRERVSVYDNVPVVFCNQPLSVDQDENESSKRIEHLDDSIIDIDVSTEDVFTEASSKEKAFSSTQESSIIKQHERRDSGVGLSLSRPISTKQSSYNQASDHIHIDCLSAGQMMVLKKLSLLKLTALMERYSPSNRSGWSWAMPKFIKRIKSPDYKDKTVFGLPLLLVLQRTGQPLPVCIQSVIHSLKKIASESVGLFRKSGVRSRIQHLKSLTENHQAKVNYENYQANDVADLFKQYFRELPEALLTNKLSETFISIFQYIPTETRFEAMQAAIFLMPDENREVVQTLLDFLSFVSHKASENQMTASNLAVCFAPSLFHMSVPRSSSNSPRRRKTVGVPDQKELKENKAAHECLTQMIAECPKLFSVSEEVINQCRFSYSEHDNLVTMNHVNKTGSENMSSWDKYVENCTAILIRDTRPEKYLGNSRTWAPVSFPDNTTDLAYKRLGDGHPLKIWRATTEVEAPPVELLNKVLRERSTWDEHLSKWRIIQKVGRNTEIYQFVAKSMSSHPARDFCVIRTWQTDLTRGGCALIEESIDHPEAQIPKDGVRGIVLTSRYLIEPCGSGKSRIFHLSRIDMRGKSPEWYNRAYGHIMAAYLTKLRDSFKHGTDGPETKV